MTIDPQTRTGLLDGTITVEQYLRDEVQREFNRLDRLHAEAETNRIIHGINQETAWPDANSNHGIT